MRFEVESRNNYSMCRHVLQVRTKQIGVHPNIICKPDFSATPNLKGVGYVYYDSMLMHRDQIAQTFASTNEQETYGTLLDRCVKTAITMQKKGVKPGDFVSLCTVNNIDTSVPYIASFFIGAITASIDPMLSAKEIVYLLKQVLPKMIFVSPSSVNLIEEVILELEFKMSIVVFGETQKHISFEKFLSPDVNFSEFRPIEIENLNKTALVTFSSGTTGKPKGICLSHLSILSNNTFLEKIEYMRIALFYSPYWTINHHLIHRSIMNGFETIIFNENDLKDIWKLLNFQVDYTFLTPSESMAFLSNEKPKNTNLSNLKKLFIGGNRMSKEHLIKLKACLPQTNVCYTYGQSEVFKTIFEFAENVEDKLLAQKYPHSVGRPVQGVSYKIVHLETEEILGPNQQGELRIKSQCQTTGYLNHDSSELFDADNFIKTGDLAYYNEELCFFINGRFNENFKYLHHYISPFQIESVLLTHPFVKNAVVIGLPHEIDVNHPIAIIQLKETVKRQKEKEEEVSEHIIKYVDERVEDKERLRGGVKVIESFPLTASNKISRYKLTELLKNNLI